MSKLSEFFARERVVNVRVGKSLEQRGLKFPAVILTIKRGFRFRTLHNSSDKEFHLFSL